MPPVPTPPRAARQPHPLTAHGDTRADDWYWLANREDPAVTEYLNAENAYTDALLAPTLDLQERLYQAIKARIEETDVSAPARSGTWWYWTRTTEGQQYSTYCRRPDPERRLGATEVLADARAGAGTEEVVLDENVLAAGSDFFSLGVWDLSPDQQLLAYALDLDGSERYSLRFRDLDHAADLDDVIDNVSYGSAWATDNRTLFYVRTDDAQRPYQVWRHHLGTPSSDDALVFQEDDERFFVSVGLTRSERYVLVQAGSKTTSEVRWIDAAQPATAARVVLARQPGVEYDVDHAVWPGEEGPADVWLVRHNRAAPDGTPATNFALHRLPVTSSDPDDLEVILPHRRGVRLESADPFAGHLVIGERQDGLEHLRVLSLATGTDHVIAQPDPVYSLGGGMNAEWDATVYRYGYTSLTTPLSSIDYDLEGRTSTVVRVQPVHGYSAEDYRTERIWATAPDGTRVPISLVARRDQPLDGSAPCLLYGYGAYEITIDPTFSPLRLNLLERGMTFAIAHVRGGGELGREWYEDGKLARKPNTFSDFVACAEHLVAAGWTSPAGLVARGGSAGGLLMGAVTNLRPDLWRAVIAEVPFVDVVTTMSDVTLPLTVTEWEEWGNPLDDPEAYRIMKSYSPYDNVAPVDYPAVYATAGLNDPRVGYWEPAKWVAKLRATRTNERTLLLRTEMGAGHQGASGRYDAWRDEARVQAFVLTQVGIDA